MSDVAPEIDDETEHGDDDLSEQERADKSQRTANQARKARLETAALRRENAFLRAGVKLSDTQAKALSTYDGPTDDTDKIHAWAKEMFGDSVLPTAEPEPEPEPVDTNTDEEKGSTGERQGLATGATANDGRGEDPFAAAAAVAQQTVQKGGARDDAFAAAVRTVRQAGVAGDNRAVYSGPRTPVEEMPS